MTDIDREVAEKVFGYSGGKPPDGWPWWIMDEGGCHMARIPSFSTDIGFAWEVVRALSQEGFRFQLTSDEYGWHASFRGHGLIHNGRVLNYDCQYRAPLAICKAALAAAGAA